MEIKIPFLSSSDENVCDFIENIFPLYQVSRDKNILSVGYCEVLQKNGKNLNITFIVFQWFRRNH